MKIRVKYTMRAPVSHIGEVSSTGSYFQTILTSSGKLPIITGNSVRGILRDCGAKYILDKLGEKVPKEAFNILFSGGNINGAMKNDVAKAKAVRDHFPFISLFGAGLGDMIMAGKICVGNLYPLCAETAEMLEEDCDGISWRSLIDEIEFTRSDDGKNDILAGYMENPEEEKQAKASTQMRFSVQYMAAGTTFVQDIHLFDNCTDLEIGALFSAMYEWFKIPRMGGMSGKGFGLFDAQTDCGIDVVNGKIFTTPDIEASIKHYEAFIAEDNTGEWIHLIGGEKHGKA